MYVYIYIIYYIYNNIYIIYTIIYVIYIICIHYIYVYYIYITQHYKIIQIFCLILCVRSPGFSASDLTKLKINAISYGAQDHLPQ